ncbi:MAG: hypothetical protein ACRDT8_00105 [Micromonosporaceae bacterium]
MSARRGPAPFQLLDGNIVLEFGPRYRKPLDRTLIMSVFHRTTGGGRSLLLNEAGVKGLREFLADPVGVLRFTQHGTSGEVEAVDVDGATRIKVRIERCDTRDFRAVYLDTVQVGELDEWLSKLGDWDGWTPLNWYGDNAAEVTRERPDDEGEAA